MARTHYCTDRWKPGPVAACPNHKHIPQGHVSPLDERRAQEKKFNNDMHRYREARRAGLQPDQVTRDAVYKEEARLESVERGRKKLEPLIG